MAWSAPKTWSAGEIVTAILMNLHLRDNLNILKTPITDAGKIVALSGTYLEDLSAASLEGPGVVYVARQSADITKNANISPADLTGLAFPVLANKTYHFDAVLFVLSTNVADIRLDVTGPAAPTSVTYQVLGSSPILVAKAAAFGDDVSTSGLASFAQQIRLSGTIQNGANAGTVQIRGAQNTSEATNTVFYTNSWLMATRSV